MDCATQNRLGRRTLAYHMRLPAILLWGLLLLSQLVQPAPSLAADPAAAMAMIGQPSLPSDTPPAYSNPEAPKGGTLRLVELGSFDSLNPFSIRGNVPASIRPYVFESLMARHYDEAFSLYGALALSAIRETDHQLRYVLNPAARFSDGRKVRAQDVAFSWDLLRRQGRPNHRNYYNKIAKADVLNAQEIRFYLTDSTDRELPLILGLMPILPEHIYAKRDIRQPSLDKPVGSGPYLVAQVEAGRQLVLRKNPDYWGAQLPLNRGRYNFDSLQYNYFRDADTAFRAFTRGLVDIWFETDAHRWTTSYDVSAARDGYLVKQAIPFGLPSGLEGFVFNTRRAIFAHHDTRLALTILLDRASLNTMLYADANALIHSYFGGTNLSAWQVSASPAEQALLADAKLSPSALQGKFVPVLSTQRARQRTALTLLAQAGWQQNSAGKFWNPKTEDSMDFEILVRRQADERLALVYAATLKRMGINAQVRLVDDVQYQNRLRQFDYDMIIHRWFASLSPGNEQNIYWGLEAADTPGSRNYAGIRSPIIANITATLLQAESQQDFVTAARALDRLLMAGHYVIPLFYRPAQWVAWWQTHIQPPDRHALYGVQLDYWWSAR